jgi:hypothetical protein
MQNNEAVRVEHRQRLKQKDLVAALFILFSEEYDKRGVDSILDLELPLSQVREYLRDRFGIDYTSDSWIGTQLRKYEDEVGVELFRRGEGAEGYPLVGIARDMRSYFQKRHLYVTQKIKVANGVLDLVANEAPRAGKPGSPGGASASRISLLLGAGSTVTRIAEALAERIRARRAEGRSGEEAEASWTVATHNLGVVLALGAAGPSAGGHASPGSGTVELYLPEGRVDPATYAVLGRNEELYGRMAFDWSVEGASFLCGGELFVESAQESRVKTAMLRCCSGRKILVLTGHEAVDSPPPGLESFGRVDEYDYVVLPRVTREGQALSRFDLAMRDLRSFLDPWVLNWNYEVLRTRRGS